MPAQASPPLLGPAPGDHSGPGTSTLPLLSNVNLFLNNVSFLGYDWIEGLRKLSLSGQNGIPLSIPVHHVIANADPGVGTHADLDSTTFDPDPLPVMAEFPTIDLEPDLVTHLEEPCPSPIDSADSGYFLRSSQKPSLGLGKNSSLVRRGRGRKTNLFKAQSRAKEDLLGGKQISIEMALRAEKSKKKGRL